MRKRNCRVEVCFTKDELSALSKKAKKAGMSIGAFIRHSVANKEVKEAPPADVPYLIRAIRKEIKLCAAIAERSARVQENLEDIRQQESERKEKTTDELLVRRSGRTSRENDPERG